MRWGASSSCPASMPLRIRAQPSVSVEPVLNFDKISFGVLCTIWEFREFKIPGPGVKYDLEPAPSERLFGDERRLLPSDLGDKGFAADPMLLRSWWSLPTFEMSSDLAVLVPTIVG